MGVADVVVETQMHCYTNATVFLRVHREYRNIGNVTLAFAKTRLTRMAKTRFGDGENEITYERRRGREDGSRAYRILPETTKVFARGRQRQPRSRQVGNFFGRHVGNIVQLLRRSRRRKLSGNVSRSDVDRCNASRCSIFGYIKNGGPPLSSL